MNYKSATIAFILFAFCNLSFAQSEIPDLNRKVVNYVKSVVGQQVDRGECWDLANQALTQSGAKFDRSTKTSIYDFGQPVNPKKDQIFPGDIVQFDDVELEYKRGDVIYKEQMGHHTAIVVKVYEPGAFQLAHQNTSFSGKKVGVSDFTLAHVKKGQIKFFRPEEP